MARALGKFKTSMLQDLEAGKPLEIDGLLAGTLEIARKAGVQAPYTESLFGLITRARRNPRANTDEDFARSLVASPAVLRGLRSCRRSTTAPAVEACRAYALKELQRDGTSANAVVFERDQNLMHRALHAQGRQPVRVARSSPATARWCSTTRRAPSSRSSACSPTRSGRCSSPGCRGRTRRRSRSARATTALRGKARDCLELLLLDRRAAISRRSTPIASRRRTSAARSAVAAYRKANDEWRQYRDAECARRRESITAGGLARRRARRVHGRAHPPPRAGHALIGDSHHLAN